MTEVESDIRRIRASLAEKRFSDAVAGAEALARAWPENRDVLYLLAMGQRQMKRLSAALETLDRLERAHPKFSRLHQERGHCHVALKDAPRAITSYQRALEMNGALQPSWDMLAGLFRMIGEPARAAAAADQAARLKLLPPPVVEATILFSEGEPVAAEKIIRQFLIEHGDHIEAMRLLARIGLHMGVLDDAELLLAAVLTREPGYAAARHDYACVLLERHKHVEARGQLELLLIEEPGNLSWRTLHASTLVGLGRHEAAIGVYRSLIACGGSNPKETADLHLSIAHSLKTLGRREEAITSYRAAASLRPDFGDAFWSLANLKTYRFTDAEIDGVTRAEAAPGTANEDRYNLCFALGKAFEDAGDYETSYRYYERGNALKRAESRYRADVIECNTANQKTVCTSAFFAARRGIGLLANDPIFIVGLPRSGSTLIEQILASHSKVEGTQELANVPRIVLELQGRDPDLDNPRYPFVLDELPARAFEDFAQTYLDDTRVYRTGKPRFIDKMPNNFRHAGLIHLMFPNAAIIDARREPMACCFGNLKQLFARGQEFAYSIGDIARYYRTYLDLMAHWDAALPGRILRVHHEDVVDDLEGSVRRILDYCGLDFEESCLDFHKTERSVRTASSEQVRQPIYRGGLYQWRHFEPWLGELRLALGDAMTRYRA